MFSTCLTFHEQISPPESRKRKRKPDQLTDEMQQITLKHFRDWVERKESNCCSDIEHMSSALKQLAIRRTTPIKGKAEMQSRVKVKSFSLLELS
jgi:uncharacterized protein with WD repeat